MDVLTSETCWAVNWHNKASVIKLVYLYSNIKMMHGPIRIRLWEYLAHYFLEWEMFQRKGVEKIKKINKFNKFIFRKSCLLWDKVEKKKVDSGRRQMAIWRIRILYWILKATNTHSKYVIIIAFPPQQWLHERAWMLRYTCRACLLSKNLRNTTREIENKLR